MRRRFAKIAHCNLNSLNSAAKKKADDGPGGGNSTSRGCLEKNLAKRLALITLSASSPLLLACLFIDASASRWLAALLAVVQPIALMVLGASRNGSLGPLRRVMQATLVWFVAVMSALLLMAGQRLAWGGVPMTAVLMLGGLWIAPMIFLSIAYAKSFSSFSLTDDDLDRIRHLGNTSASVGKHKNP